VRDDLRRERRPRPERPAEPAVPEPSQAGPAVEAEAGVAPHAAAEREASVAPHAAAEPRSDVAPQAKAAEPVPEADVVPHPDVAPQAPAGPPAAAEPAEAGQAAGGGDDAGAPAAEVTIVPGIARYHRSECILIRFLGPEDLETMTRQAAEDAGCVPCKACRPEQQLTDP
jgi:hypothetical protein